MSNLNVLARPSASLAPARRPHPLHLRNCWLEKKKCKNFNELLLTQMAALGCCQLDRSSCPKAAIKIAIEKLATITIYKFSERKTIIINLLKIIMKMHN
jgi:hypothetical protein